MHPNVVDLIENYEMALITNGELANQVTPYLSPEKIHQLRQDASLFENEWPGHDKESNDVDVVYQALLCYGTNCLQD